MWSLSLLSKPLSCETVMQVTYLSSPLLYVSSSSIAHFLQPSNI